ncbi:MAG TPA: hypothetical protein V6D15_16220 [Oculatellaceae cyanobacterium]
MISRWYEKAEIGTGIGIGALFSIIYPNVEDRRQVSKGTRGGKKSDRDGNRKIWDAITASELQAEDGSDGCNHSV